MVSTISSAPPESASSLPNMAPRAISVPTPAAVEPKPLVKLSMVSDMATPATAPTVSDPRVSPRNGCSLKRVISTTITAMPSRAAGISRAAGMSGISAASAAVRMGWSRERSRWS